MTSIEPTRDARRRSRLRRGWDREAVRYDTQIARTERRILAESRRWVCARATGRVLEIAVGTGLNLRHYPDGAQIVGIDWSDPMLRRTRDRAATQRRSLALLRADAGALPFADGVFDSVVCTFSLCCVPDLRAALVEAARVLVPGGRLLVVDHVASTRWAVRGAQRLAEIVSVPWRGEHLTRRPLSALVDVGFTVVATERLHSGIVERVHAARP